MFIPDSEKISVLKTVTGGIAIDSCGRAPRIAEEITLLGTERQAERLFSGASSLAARAAQIGLDVAPSTVQTEFGSMFITQFKQGGGYGTVLIMQRGPLMISLIIGSTQALVAADYQEVADAAMERIRLAQLGR